MDSAGFMHCFCNNCLRMKQISSYATKERIFTNKSSCSNTATNRTLACLINRTFYRTHSKFSARIQRTRLSKYAKAFQILLFIFLFGPSSAFPQLCAEAEPIDLLAYALSDAETLPMGAEVVEDRNNVKGYRFDTSARLVGVDSSDIFPLCNRFPAEFSIIVTFQHHTRMLTNEFLMTLLAPDRHTVLLALRLRQDRLFFDFKARSTGEKITSNIRSTGFSDGQWHTVVITVTSTNIKFTLDCTTPLNKELDTQFPRKMNVRSTRIYVASRRTKRRRFTGILRQLVLLPGADAAVRMCPSDNPTLATLDDRTATATPSTSPVIFEEDFPTEMCSMDNKGSLMYRRDQTMKICTGYNYETVRGGHERMDYVIDYEDVITNNYTSSMESFYIRGEGLFLATANNDDMKTNQSHIFKWDGREFVKFQSLKTRAAMMWRYFKIGSEHFLVVANSGAPGDTDLYSVIYRWYRRESMFVLHQMIPTYRTRSVEVFSIESMHFMVVANQNNFTGTMTASTEKGNYTTVYKWDPDSRRFRFCQYILTHDVLDITFFTISFVSFRVNCFAVANDYNGEKSSVTSDIFCWFDNRFMLSQSISTVGAADWEYFQIQDRYFLAVANSYDKKLGDVTSQRRTISTIYELNLRHQMFYPYQEIETYGAKDWEFFMIGSQYFLVLCNSVLSSTTEIYRWKGLEKFVKVHSLEVGSCGDVDYIQIDGHHYLSFANPVGTLSKLFKIVTY